MFGKASAKNCKVLDGIGVSVEHWEKLRRILSIRLNKSIDDKTIMQYVLTQGNLLKADAKYGIFFDIDGENVIMEV